jgi:hypothetical protein
MSGSILFVLLNNLGRQKKDENPGPRFKKDQVHANVYTKRQDPSMPRVITRGNHKKVTEEAVVL